MADKTDGKCAARSYSIVARVSNQYYDIPIYYILEDKVSVFLQYAGIRWRYYKDG